MSDSSLIGSSNIEAFCRSVLSPAEPGFVISYRDKGELTLCYHTHQQAATAASFVKETLNLSSSLGPVPEDRSGKCALTIKACGWLMDDLENHFIKTKERHEFLTESLRARFSETRLDQGSQPLRRIPLANGHYYNMGVIRLQCPSNDSAKALSTRLGAYIAHGIIRLSAREQSAVKESNMNYRPVESSGPYVTISGLDGQPGMDGGILAEVEQLGCPEAKTIREKLSRENTAAALKAHVGVSFGGEANVRVGAEHPTHSAVGESLVSDNSKSSIDI